MKWQRKYISILLLICSVFCSAPAVCGLSPETEKILETRLMLLDNTLQELLNENKMLSRRLSEREKELTALQENSAESEAAWNASRASLQTEIESLRATIASKEMLIANLRTEIEEIRNQLTESDDSQKKLEKSLASASALSRKAAIKAGVTAGAVCLVVGITAGCLLFYGINTAFGFLSD